MPKLKRRVGVSADTAFRNALAEVFQHGVHVSPRSKETLELLNYSFTPINPDNNIIHVGGFETDEQFSELEWKWYLSQDPDTSWHPRIENAWAKVGIEGEAASNYGHRIWGAHEDFPDQIQWVVDELKRDRHSRRAVINLNYPGDKLKQHRIGRDKQQTHEIADFPCTMSVQFFIRDNRLYCMCHMRSNDLVLGFRTDLYTMTELQKLVHSHLQETYDNLLLGGYCHSANSLHLYKRHFDTFREYVERENFDKQRGSDEVIAAIYNRPGGDE